MEIKYKNVSLQYMLESLVNEIVNEIVNEGVSERFYWYHEDTGFHEIIECDLMRGRFITDDGDFSEFVWEKEKSNIYVKVVS